MVFHISESRNDTKQNRGRGRRVYSPLPLPPTEKFASQVDAHERTDAQIKFLYYPLVCSLNSFQPSAGENLSDVTTKVALIVKST